MSGSKSIYNSSTLDCALEVLWRTMGVRIDQTSANCSVQAVDGEFSKLTVAAKAQADNGSLSSYYGTSEFSFRKLDLESILPTDLAYDGEYPAPFQRLQEFFFFSYDFVLESGEFVLEGGSTTPLVPTDIINLAANSEGQIVLVATVNSGRWKVGSRIRIKLLSYDN